MSVDAFIVGDRFFLWCYEPGRKTDQGHNQAPPSVAVRQATGESKHVEENLVRLVPPLSIPESKLEARDGTDLSPLLWD